MQDVRRLVAALLVVGLLSPVILMFTTGLPSPWPLVIWLSVTAGVLLLMVISTYMWWRSAPPPEVVYLDGEKLREKDPPCEDVLLLD